MSSYRTDMRMSGRHPFELFTLYLAILVSLPTVLGITPEPNSVADILPPVVVTTWSWVLFLGSSLAVVGVYLRDRATGLILEQLGLGFVGVASLIYVACALKVVGEPAIQPAALIGGFGASCLWRYGQIQKILNKVRGRQNTDGKWGQP